MSPRLIQRKRVAGWRLPPNTMTITRPGYWGNPFVVGMTVGEVRTKNSSLWDLGGLPALPDEHVLTAQECVDAYARWIHLETGESGRTMAYEASIRLRDKDLACWCSEGSPCHGTPLLRAANSEVQS